MTFAGEGCPQAAAEEGLHRPLPQRRLSAGGGGGQGRGLASLAVGAGGGVPEQAAYEGRKPPRAPESRSSAPPAPESVWFLRPLRTPPVLSASGGGGASILFNWGALGRPKSLVFP